MSPVQIAALIIRVSSIWLGIYVLRMIPSLAITAHSGPGFAYDLFLFAVTAIIAAVLWFFPGTVAGKILRVSGVPGEGRAASLDAWFAMGCALLGLWVLTYAVPALVRDAFVLDVSASTFDDTTTVKSWMLYNSIEVAIGSWLVLGAQGFRKLFWWARNAGTSKTL
jgi:hypothetical protein